MKTLELNYPLIQFIIIVIKHIFSFLLKLAKRLPCDLQTTVYTCALQSDNNFGANNTLVMRTCVQLP